MGISRQTLDNWIKGSSDPRYKDIENASKILGKNFTGQKKEGELLDHPLVKSYVEQIKILQDLVQVLKRENEELRDKQ